MGVNRAEEISRKIPGYMSYKQRLKMATRLNALPCHADLVCTFCGLKFPEIIINVEGVIHHRGIPQCLDVKACIVYQKKMK